MICEKSTEKFRRLAGPGSRKAFVRQPRPRICLRTGLFAVAVLTVLLFATPFPVPALETIVVKSADLKPYQDVIRGVKKACGCTVREIRVGDATDALAVKKADAIVAVGTTAFGEVRSSKDIPVVYVMVMPSETEPPLLPNISGVSMDLSPDAYIAAMIDLFPARKRVGLLYDPGHTAAFAAAAVRAAAAARVQLVTGQVRAPRDVPRALQEMSGKIDIFWMLPDPTVVTHETVDYLLRFSVQRSLPVFTFSKKYVAMGAVAALDIDPYDMGVQAGELVRKLSSGKAVTKRAYARAWHLSINRNVAAKMGITIGPQIIMQGGPVE